jgi:hypothetical protein
VVAAARTLWPVKTAEELATRSGQKPRAAEYQLAGSRSMSAEALIRLVRAPEGPEFVAAMTADLPASEARVWWRAMADRAKRQALRARIAATRAELDELEDQATVLRLQTSSSMRPRRA